AGAGAEVSRGASRDAPRGRARPGRLCRIRPYTRAPYGALYGLLVLDLLVLDLLVLDLLVLDLLVLDLLVLDLLVLDGQAGSRARASRPGAAPAPAQGDEGPQADHPRGQDAEEGPDAPGGRGQVGIGAGAGQPQAGRGLEGVPQIVHGRVPRPQRGQAPAGLD